MAYFIDFENVELSERSLYFVAPDSYLRNQIFSYGASLEYTMTYSGYEFEGA